MGARINIQQHNQLITIESPLGKNTLLMHRFNATEQLSSPFSLSAIVLSTEADIDPNEIIAKPVTIAINSDPENPRYFNGVVSRWSKKGMLDHSTYQYSMTIVPWLDMLRLRQGVRIFQEQSTQQIITKIFQELGFKDFIWKLQRQYLTREYCVQFRETDFAFVNRLLEEEGIYYYFAHEQEKHTLVLCDYPGGYRECAKPAIDVVSGSHTDFAIRQWERNFNLVSGKIELNDYNFTTPAINLKAATKSNVSLPNIDKFEIYDFPGEYGTVDEGNGFSNTRMEAVDSGHSIVEATCDYPGMTPGYIFMVGRHWDKAEKKAKFLPIRVTHTGTEGSYYSGNGQGSYANQITCVPAETIMRPKTRTPKPRVGGTQTALVVGPPGEEIYTDRYGRIKVQFHWDREGKRDDKSSCWIRVAQCWAGKNWGMQFIPRVGQEVVVSFLDGDPDRPLIIGSVYNEEQMPPYDLPTNRTHSGVKTRSSKQGSGSNYNEVMFIDEKGSELLRVHAEKDRQITVENNDRESVGNDQTTGVGNNQSISVGNDQSTKVGNNESFSIGKDQTTSTGRDQTATVGRDQVNLIARDLIETVGRFRVETINQWRTTVTHNHEHTVHDHKIEKIYKTETQLVAGVKDVTVGGASVMKVGAASTTTVAGADSLTVGASQATTVGGSQTTSIGGNQTQAVAGESSKTVGGSDSQEVAGNQTVGVGGDAEQAVAGAAKQSVGGDNSVEVGSNDNRTVGASFSMETGENATIKAAQEAKVEAQKLVLKAKDELVLQVGHASIVMSKTGDIKINGLIDQEPEDITADVPTGMVTIEGRTVTLQSWDAVKPPVSLDPTMPLKLIKTPKKTFPV